MIPLLLILLLATPAVADDCGKSWKLLVVGGQMQPNTWDNCKAKKAKPKVGLSPAEYKAKQDRERDEYANKKREEYESHKAKTTRPGNGYGDKNHTHTGPRENSNVTKSKSGKGTGKGKVKESKQRLPRVSKQEGGAAGTRAHPQDRVKRNAKS